MFDLFVNIIHYKMYENLGMLKTYIKTEMIWQNR